MDFAGEIHVFFDVGDVGDVDIPQGIHRSHGKSPFLLVISRVRSSGTTGTHPSIHRFITTFPTNFA